VITFSEPSPSSGEGDPDDVVVLRYELTHEPAPPIMSQPGTAPLP
jgi:hypothetical protein